MFSHLFSHAHSYISSVIRCAEWDCHTTSPTTNVTTDSRPDSKNTSPRWLCQLVFPIIYQAPINYGRCFPYIIWLNRSHLISKYSLSLTGNTQGESLGCLLRNLPFTDDEQYLIVQPLSRVRPTLCDRMDCSTAGFPVLHQLLELVHTHVHWVSDAIQPSRPLSSPSSPAFSLSQHHGLF